MAPLILAASIVFLVLVHGWEGKLAMCVYLASSLVLFGNSATYHIGRWGPKVKSVLRRIDHANIYLFIAGTYTPLAVLLLEGPSRVAILTLVWVSAAAGVCFRVFWMSAPRWLYVVLYLGMGWAAMAWLPQFWETGGPAIVWLLLGGGLAYSVGAFSYAKKWPNPSPNWFGFHEIFHSWTVIAAACHFVAIGLAVTHSWA
jgi:hemolysin III